MKLAHKLGFGKSAITYDTAAQIHHKIADDLANMLYEVIDDLKHKNISIIDIGAGTGILSEKISNIFCNAKITLSDISYEMLSVAREKFQIMFDYQHGDAENIDISNYEMIVSSMAMHWFNDIDYFIKEKTRHSKIFAFAIPVAGTFQEWYDIFNAVNIISPKIPYKSEEEMQCVCNSARFLHKKICCKKYTIEFKSVMDVMKYIKSLGAYLSVNQYNTDEIKTILNQKNEFPIIISYNILFGVLSR